MTDSRRQAAAPAGNTRPGGRSRAEAEGRPALPEVPDDRPTDPAERRKQTFWMVLLCLILILVTIVLIVNEKLQ